MVYDNIFVQKQIAMMVKTMESELRVNIMDMQMQAGTCYCGLFVVAAATSLLNGDHPGDYNQSQMSKHLYECLNEGNIMQFPLLKEGEVEGRLNILRPFRSIMTAKCQNHWTKTWLSALLVRKLMVSQYNGALQDLEVCHHCK